MEAQDRKFVGFKTTTCKVQVASDTPLLELYSSGPLDISVVISDINTNSIVFAGYVVPFTFEQPYTGVHDVVTIDCVDAVTAAKGELYRSANDDMMYGVDEPAEAIVNEVRSHAGKNKVINKVIYHTNFGDNTSGKTFDAKVAQAGFLQDGMTSVDALSAACMFFGYTSVLIGDTLYLYDEHCLINAGDGNKRCALAYDFTTGEGERYQEDGSPLRLIDASELGIINDIMLSIEPAYDAIQITPKGRSTSLLLPDVCSTDSVIGNTDGRGKDNIVYDDYDTAYSYLEYRKPVMSDTMDFGQYSSGDDDIFPWRSPAQMKPSSDSGWWTNGAMMFIGQHFSFDESKSYFTGGERKNLVWLRANLRDGVAGKQYKCYSHTGGLLKLNISFDMRFNDAARYDGENEPKGRWIGFVQVRVGGKYYNGESGQYLDEPQRISLDKNGGLAPSKVGKNNYTTDYIVSAQDGQVALELRWKGHAADGFELYTDPNSPLHGSLAPAIFISSLSLESVGDDIWLGDADMRHEFVAHPSRVLDVETALTTRQSNQSYNPDAGIHVYGVNARPGIVPGVMFPCGGYMGVGSQFMPISGVLMTQLKARYGSPRERYTMTVRTVDILPSDTIRFGEKNYTIEGYEKDLVNSTTKIIIN